MTMSAATAILAIALTCTLSASVAHAQTGDRAATAEDLFRQGLQLTRSGRFADACPKFAESHRLDPAFGALINLAACYEKLGRTASAWQAYVDAADLARDKGQPARAKTARDKASRLAPRLVRLEIRLGPDVEARGLTITRNGAPVDPALVGHAVPVDPGDYEIVATRQGAEPWSTSVTAKQPGQITVEVTGPIARSENPATPEAWPAVPRAPSQPATDALLPPEPSKASAVSPAADDAAGPPGSGLRRTGVAMVVGGAVLAAAGGAFAWRARSISNDTTMVQPGERFDPDREDRAKTYQLSAFVLWGVGATAIATGTTLYLVGHNRAARAELTVAPVVLRGGGAAMVTWRW
jgi:hypothetical protein